jgi:hypothetical protein
VPELELVDELLVVELEEVFPAVSGSIVVVKSLVLYGTA